MKITVAEVSALLNGEVVGNGSLLLNKVAKIDEGTEGALSFLANPKYETHIYDTKSTAVLVNRSFEPVSSIKATLIKVDDAYASFTFLLDQFADVYIQKSGISPFAVIDKSVQLPNACYVGAFTVMEQGSQIGENTKIFPQVYIGDRVKIGKNCILYAGVKIYHDSVIGDNCIIHANTVIGSDGFGFAPLADKSYKKIPQTGNVIIEDNVEIGSNCAIDRATMGSTIIKTGAKLDNLIQIAHNVEIGEHTVMAGQAGVAGSTKVGKYCVIGGQVAISGHITVADNTSVGGQSGVLSSIKEENTKLFGSPAFDFKDNFRAQAIFRKLPTLEKRISQLEKLLKEKLP